MLAKLFYFGAFLSFICCICTLVIIWREDALEIDNKLKQKNQRGIKNESTNRAGFH